MTHISGHFTHLIVSCFDIGELMILAVKEPTNKLNFVISPSMPVADSVVYITLSNVYSVAMTIKDTIIWLVTLKPYIQTMCLPAGTHRKLPIFPYEIFFFPGFLRNCRFVGSIPTKMSQQKAFRQYLKLANQSTHLVKCFYKGNR